MSLPFHKFLPNRKSRGPSFAASGVMKSFRLMTRAIVYTGILTWGLIGVMNGRAALIPPEGAKVTHLRGRVQFVLRDALGKPAGIVLKDRSVVLFHPESLRDARPPSVGDLVDVRGYYNLQNPNWVLQQAAIMDQGRLILDEMGTPNPVEPPDFEAPGRFTVLKKAELHSSVFALVARGDGQLDRLVLSDGTFVQVSSGGVVDKKKLKLNAPISIAGIGTGSGTGTGSDVKSGRFVQAMSIKDTHQFQQIIAQGDERQSWMTIQGKIAQTLLTPRGLINGVILGDHTAIRFRPVPPEDTSQLSPGTRVEAAGTGKENQVFVGSVLIIDQKGRKGIGLSTSTSSNLPNPEPSRSLDRMYDQSQILTVLKDAYGDPETLILSDGASIQIPPDIRRGLDFFPKPGETVSLEGYGGKYADGIAIRASSLRRDPDNDQNS
jgi:hypothetical protein